MSEDREYYDELEVRSASARQHAEARDLVQADCARQGERPLLPRAFFQTSIQRRSPRATALARLPITRKSDLKDIQTRHAPFGGLNGWDIGRFAHIYQSPGPIYEPDSDSRGSLAICAILMGGRRAARDDCPQHVFLSPDAGRHDHRVGCARHRVPGHSRWRRQHRAAGAGDRRSASRRVLRHAVVPEDTAGEGSRNPAPTCRR